MTGEKLSTSTHVLIGAGRMGGALLSGWLSGRGSGKLNAAEILVIDPSPGEAANKALALGAKFSNRLTKGAASGLKLCLLAVKPQMFADIGPGLAMVLPKDTLVVSIMAGISLERLNDVFGPRPVIRAMPNTPAAYGKGITAYVCGDGVDEAQRDLVELRLKAGGQVVRVENERQIDMVTAVSGSGPAYVFFLTEALEAAGMQLGLPEELARALARQTVVGSGFMLGKSEKTAAQLRQDVTSPGGTTQAALEVLMAEDGLPSIMRKAVNAAFVRSRELGGR
ncbi:MAG: pyrroline-5-carboxylate reductase [Robiginitomaculum sp.]|nr:MAG: pyrroline-5-carboxylate reductase [Robiginitomaculum sp.]